MTAQVLHGTNEDDECLLHGDPRTSSNQLVSAKCRQSRFAVGRPLPSDPQIMLFNSSGLFILPLPKLKSNLNVGKVICW